MSHPTLTSVAENIHNTSIVDKYEDDEDETVFFLPPHICLNQREKIQPIQDYHLKVTEKKGPPPPKPFAGLIWVPEHKKMPPMPKHEHWLIWWPKNLCFRLKDHDAKINLNILNTSKRIIYIQYKGLWDKTVQSGASWFVQPKTRMLVAPGMVVKLHVRARPRKTCLIPYGFASLQIATNIQNDLVVGYFVVPVGAVFENYVSSYNLAIEEEEEKVHTSNSRSSTFTS